MATYQPGGTATVICDNWTSRVIDRGEDPLGLGRWTFVTLRGKGSKKLTVVTAYNSTSSTGDKTYFQQQNRVLSQIIRNQAHHILSQPRRQFILDLQGWLQTKIDDGHELIVSMDANDTYNPDTPGVAHPVTYHPDRPTLSPTHNGKLGTLITSCGLRDPLALQHESRPFPASHIRGSQRIDFILVTPGILPAVTCSGSLGFQSLFHSDHRAYYVDFDAVQLFSDPAYEIASPCHRKLQLSDPRLKTDQGTWTDVDTQTYQSLDRVITESMLHAEANTGRRVSTRYEWSPELKKAVNLFRYWQLRSRQTKNHKVNLSRLQVLQDQAGLTPDQAINISATQILEHLQAAATTLRQYQKRHRELRATYLEGLAEAIVLDRSPNLEHSSVAHVKEERVSSQIRHLLKRENLRRMFRKIKRILKPVSNLGLSKIDIPDPDASSASFGDPSDPKQWKGPWVTVTKPTDIALVVRDINQKQYHQAHVTPFGTGPVADAFGRRGDTTQADLLLQGIVPPSLADTPMLPETRSILNTIATEFPVVAAQSGVITQEEFISAYKVTHENTSSSPSGRHIGHYKVAASDPTLAQLHSRMMSFPFVHGFAPDRWKRVTDIMLEKEPGNSRCHRLRILALFESDFNQAKRLVIGRRLMHHLEDFKLLSSMQYGSRPGRQCVSAVLKKVLAHDYARLTVTTASFIENDAIGCYDRLVNNLILMLLKKLGLPASVSDCMGEVWDNVVHLIKTIYGITDITYGSSPDTPLYGPGQGSTCGPLFWLLCYWVIVNSIDPTISTMKFTSACKTVIVEVMGSSFVDDSSLGVTSNYQYDPSLSLQENRHKEVEHIVSQLASLAQHWERLLFSTGGAINMQKSHWYLMTWLWSNGVPRLATARDTPASLPLT